MDGRGGCCIARYGGNMYDMSKMDRIMQRYRPIAPKPATNSSGSGSSENASSGYVKTGRAKRRYVRNNSGKKKMNNKVNNNNNNGAVRKKCKVKGGGEKGKSSSSEEENESMNGRSTVSTGSVSGGDGGGGGGVVTLPLLPETPETKVQSSSSPQECPATGASSFGVEKEKAPVLLNLGTQLSGREAGTVVTWVRVECITGAGFDDVYGGGCGGGGLLVGCTDEEKVMRLDADTCPGFISDGLNRVVWVNKAYRKMVAGQLAVEEEVLVRLVMTEGVQQLPSKSWPGFTCRVRVVTCGKGKSSSHTLPCDVWRLGSGHGFAWRLDTKAALSLGR